MNTLNIPVKLFLLLQGLFLISACTSPTDKFLRYANSHNLSQNIVQAADFQLQTFSNAASGNTLAIYLDGDGTPWVRGRHPAFDPTPRSLMALQLMQQDSRPAIYIGRPCYFELGPDHLCSNELWTQGRYSHEVVDNINTAVTNLLHNSHYQSVQLIGFSGGGALAMLIANRRNDIDSVITVAGNLNTHAWTKHHGYLPLTSSLNPADDPSLTIPSLHLIGGRDLAVPPKIIESYLNNHSGNRLLFPEFNHHCCWSEEWPNILQKKFNY